MSGSFSLRLGGICLEQPRQWESILWGRVVPFLVLINIALNPFPHTTSIREITFYSVAALLIFYLFRYRDWSVFRTPFTLPVVFFVAWAVVGLFWALDFGASLHDIRAHLLKYIVLFLLLTTFLKSSAKSRLIFWVVSVSVLVAGFHDIYLFYFVDNNSILTRLLLQNHQLPVGPLGFMALFSVACCVYLWRTTENPWERLALVSCFLGLFLIFFVTQMRSLFVALPFVACALFWGDKKKIIIVMAVVFLVSFGFFTTIRSLGDFGFHADRLTMNRDRLTINYISLLMVRESPVTGIGFSMETPGSHNLINHEALRAKVPEKIRHETVEYNNPHNEWLGLAVRLGLVGLFFFVWIFVSGARVCFAAIRQAFSRELRIKGQLCLSFIVLFAVYGLFNVIFTHLLEMLLCLSFALMASLPGRIAAPGSARRLIKSDVLCRGNSVHGA